MAGRGVIRRNAQSMGFVIRGYKTFGEAHNSVLYGRVLNQVFPDILDKFPTN